MFGFSFFGSIIPPQALDFVVPTCMYNISLPKTAKDKLKTDYEDGLGVDDALKLAASVHTKSMRMQHVGVRFSFVEICICDTIFCVYQSMESILPLNLLQVLSKTMDITPTVERMEFATLTRTAGLHMRAILVC